MAHRVFSCPQPKVAPWFLAATGHLWYDGGTKRKGVTVVEIMVFVMIPLALILFALAVFGVVMFIRMMILVFRALKKYLDGDRNRGEEVILRKSLGEVLKEHRTRCSMTQEFVAEAMGVTRQAVSKWENGTADPSTSNLLKLAKLYGITPEELIRAVQHEAE
jgi:DNA-binding XRE family transcriptional regulator